MSSVDPAQMDIEALRAKIRGGSPLTPAERDVAQRLALNASSTIPEADPMVTGLLEEALASPQPDAPPTGGFVRHGDLVEWVEEVLAPKLQGLSDRCGRLETELAALQELVGPHSVPEQLEALRDQIGAEANEWQRRSEAWHAKMEATHAEAATVVEEANAKMQAVEQHLVGHDTRLDELAAELDRRVPQEPESSPEP